MAVKLPKDFTFDFRTWSTRFSLCEYRRRIVEKFGSKGLYQIGGMPVMTPQELVYLEELRAEIRAKFDVGRSVPADVFVFAVGEPSRRDVTKIGGLPYRPAGLAWPLSANGQPLTFAAQLRFTESHDIVGKVPGDVLLVFVRDETVAEGEEASEVVFEWYPLGLKKLIPKEEVPSPAWTFVSCYGIRYRTSDFPEKKAEDAARSYLAEKACTWNVFRYEGTKIGGAPYWIQDVLGKSDYPGRFLGTIGSVSPAPECEFPWANQREPMSWRDCVRAENSFQWGDSGMLYLFLTKSGRIRWRLQYY